MQKKMIGIFRASKEETAHGSNIATSTHQFVIGWKFVMKQSPPQSWIRRRDDRVSNFLCLRLVMRSCRYEVIVRSVFLGLTAILLKNVSQQDVEQYVLTCWLYIFSCFVLLLGRLTLLWDLWRFSGYSTIISDYPRRFIWGTLVSFPTVHLFHKKGRWDILGNKWSWSWFYVKDYTDFVRQSILDLLRF